MSVRIFDENRKKEQSHLRFGVKMKALHRRPKISNSHEKNT